MDGFDKLVQQIMREDGCSYSAALRQAYVECGKSPLDREAWKIRRRDGISYADALRQAIRENPEEAKYVK